MRISDLAKCAGVTTKTVRFYEKAGLLDEPGRTAGGYRDYPAGAVARLRFIRAAQSAGLTLAEIREVLALRGSGQPPCRNVTALLKSHLDQVEQRIGELEHARAMLRDLHARAAATDPRHVSRRPRVQHPGRHPAGAGVSPGAVRRDWREIACEMRESKKFTIGGGGWPRAV